MVQRKQTQLVSMRTWVPSLASLGGLRIWGCQDLQFGGHRRSSDLALLWLWRRLTAVAPIQPLVWELSYAAGTTLKKRRKKYSQNKLKSL